MISWVTSFTQPWLRLAIIRLLLLGWLSPVAGAVAEPLQVAVAANFAAPANALAKAFTQASGRQVLVSTGSSGKLFAQIQHGAPYDVFLSADQAKPVALQQAGLVLADSRFTYAIGNLVLWSPADSDAQAIAARLQRGDFARLALANPRLAPYGLAAVETLQVLQLSETTRSRWVLGENIAQTFQFVSSGNVDMGFIALSQWLAHQQRLSGGVWLVPDELYAPIRQDAVGLRRSSQPELAAQFLTFLSSETARDIIRTQGYRLPDNE